MLDGTRFDVEGSNAAGCSRSDARGRVRSAPRPSGARSLPSSDQSVTPVHEWQLSGMGRLPVFLGRIADRFDIARVGVLIVLDPAEASEATWWMIECSVGAGVPVEMDTVIENWSIIRQAELHLLQPRGACVTAMVLSAVGETRLAKRFTGWARDHDPSGVFDVFRVWLADFGLDAGSLALAAQHRSATPRTRRSSCSTSTPAGKPGNDGEPGSSSRSSAAAGW